MIIGLCLEPFPNIEEERDKGGRSSVDDDGDMTGEEEKGERLILCIFVEKSGLRKLPGRIIPALRCWTELIYHMLVRR